MSIRHIALALVLVLGSAPGVLADEEAPNPVQSFLDGLTLGEGTATPELVIFPLIAKDKPEDLALQPSAYAKAVGYFEPEFPKRRFNVGVINNETKPLLLLGGTVLGGGARDRVVPSDVVIPVGARVEIETIVAAPTGDHRKEPAPFQLGSALAPPYIRERAEFSPSNSLVPNFVARFLEFRNPGDERKSLSAINGSDQLTELCLSCHQALGEFPLAEGGRVVGMVTAVRGRIQSLEVFGDNRLFKAWFAPLLKSHTFGSAAIAVKAKQYNIAIPENLGSPESMRALQASAQKLLDDLKKARLREGDTPKNSLGDVTLLRTSDSTRGAGMALDGRLVHLAVFPYDPFEHAFFGSRVEAPQEASEYGSSGEPALERKGRNSRLTEFERRLLERMRRRR